MDYLWTPWRYNYVTEAETKKRPGIPEELSAWPGDTGCVFCNIIAAADYAIEHGMARARRRARRRHRPPRPAQLHLPQPLPLHLRPHHGRPLRAPGVARRASSETAHEMMDLAQRSEQGPDRGLPPRRLQHRPQPRQIGRRRRRRPRPPPCSAALDRRHQLHDRRRRNPRPP